MKKKVGRIESFGGYTHIRIDINYGMSSREYTITRDEATDELTGDVVAHGSWYDIDIDEINEVLGYFTDGVNLNDDTLSELYEDLRVALIKVREEL